MFKHLINNNFINVQHLESKPLSLIHLTLELPTLNVQDQSLTKEIVLHHMLLLQLEPSLIDSALPTKKTIQSFLLNRHQLVIKQLTQNVKEDMLAELLTMLKFMDQLIKIVFLITHKKITPLIAQTKSKTALNIRSMIIV